MLQVNQVLDLEASVQVEAILKQRVMLQVNQVLD
jgi:hypothetical protein